MVENFRFRYSTVVYEINQEFTIRSGALGRHTKTGSLLHKLPIKRLSLPHKSNEKKSHNTLHVTVLTSLFQVEKQNFIDQCMNMAVKKDHSIMNPCQYQIPAKQVAQRHVTNADPDYVCRQGHLKVIPNPITIFINDADSCESEIA